MAKDTRFIAELCATKPNGAGWNFARNHGAARGHSMIWVGKDRVTTVPSRMIDPKTERKIRKALGLD
jgi:hypothetical protein